MLTSLSRQTSSINVSRLGRKLLDEIDRLEQVLKVSGAMGFSLLMGTKEIHNETAIQTKLKSLDEELLPNKEKQISQFNEASEIARKILHD